MPTKKQRRRRQKGRRHEYEYVYVDEAGRELEVDEAGEAPKGPATGKGGGAPAAKRTRGAAVRGGGRTVQPPSLKRVLWPRGAIFAVFMFVVLSILDNGELGVSGRVIQTVFLMLVFLPASYVMDSVTYRIWKKRAGPQGEPARRG